MGGYDVVLVLPCVIDVVIDVVKLLNLVGCICMYEVGVIVCL